MICATILSVESIFSEWLNGELDRLGWSMNKLASKAGLSSGTLSNIMSGNRQPGPDFCRSIARALQIPEEEVFRRAGLLSPEQAKDPLLERANHLLELLPPDDQERVLAIIQTFYERQLIAADKKKRNSRAPLGDTE